MQRCLFLCCTLLNLGYSNGVLAVNEGGVRFDRDIRPILSDKCFQCHGPDEKHRKASLRLDRKSSAYALRDGEAAVRPGDPLNSILFQRVASEDQEERMPPTDSGKKPLTRKEIETVQLWIEQGASWSGHWAFQVPVKPELPSIPDSSWSINPIDHFVLAALDRNGLHPSPEADRRILARRLSFDLTGLPPDLALLDHFENDNMADAYENLVDTLLASQGYGERMAVMWLDAARYGDTSVFHADGSRDMWPWRDWVIEAYNSNKSFKEFSLEQLAGDLLVDSTVHQKIATGFNRNNATTDEGGIIEEEFRIEYAVDRVRTTSMVWLGLSLECAQCHDHKYDPFTMKDYYQFLAYFNRASDPGRQTRNGNQVPVADYYDPERIFRGEQLWKGLPQLEKRLADRSVEAADDFNIWLEKAKANPDSVTVDLLPRDPVVHLPLDDKVTDIANSDRAGKVDGDIKWRKGKINGAFQFDGSNCIDLGDVADFDRLDAFSFGCWVYPHGESGGALLGRMDEEANNRGFFVAAHGVKLQVMIANQWPLNSLFVTGSDKMKLVPGQWQHVFVTYDGSSKASGILIYVNGVTDNQGTVSDSLTSSIRNANSLLVGRRYYGPKGSPFKGLIDDVRIYDRELSKSEVEGLAGLDSITPLLQKDSPLDAGEKDALRHYYLNHDDSAYLDLAIQLRDQKAEAIGLKRPLTNVMVMHDVDKPRETFILKRGAYDQPSKTRVFPSPLALLARQAEGAPKNRLGMAQWLFQENHPLTARVAVNRYWQMLFGAGIVSTPEDFGSQGEYPSHPKLLDWLAVEFREGGWDVKRILKLMVMSATYRQSSNVTGKLLKMDPGNSLLARGPRFRLQAEFLRDASLAVSGLLVRDLGGPGVKPYQPLGLWAEVALGGDPKFVMDQGEALYRRSLYTYWKRSAPPPSMQIFDAPTRERCMLRRSRTNTPLQALVTLNDVQFVEAARNLAQRVLHSVTDTDEQRFDEIYRIVLARNPREKERAVLEKIYVKSFERFSNDNDAAEKLLTFGKSSCDESLDPALHAAWTVVSSVVLNLDESIMRN